MKKIFGITCRGVSLVEVLVASVIGGVIILGSLQSLKFAMQAGGISKAILTENDFKLTLSNALDKNCDDNLKPEKLTGSESSDGIGEVENLRLKEGEDNIISKGPFKGDIQVVKMEVKGDKTTDSREFIAYYKKNNLGDLNTVSGLECDATATPQKLSGCFKARCKLRYSLTEGTPKVFDKCESLTCHPVVLQVAGSRFPCPWGLLYNPDHNKPGNTKPKCDPVEKPPNCDPSSYISTGKELVDGKCKCKGSSKLTADGRCIFHRYSVSYITGMSWKDTCWDISPSANYPHTKRNSEAVLDSFCQTGTNPQLYRAKFNCLKWTGPGDAYGCSGGCILFWRRFYNRETGQVHCIRYVHQTNHPDLNKAIPVFFSIGPQTQ